jgi:cell division protein FtsQ
MLASAALHHPLSASDETPQDVVWMNAAAMALFAIALVLLLAASLTKLSRLPYFNLQRVQIEGDLVRNNLATVRANIVPRMRGGFFNVELEHSREVFEDVPWVRKAVVRRVWPNELRVVLEEHKPAAYWRRTHAEDQLVNTHGEVFDANLGDVEDEHLPVFDAPATPTEEDAKAMLAMLQRLKPALEPLGDIESIKLTDRGSWSVELDTDATIQLGRGSIEEVLARTDRFVRTLPEVHRQYPSPLAYADLRYPEAYAVKLRGVTTIQEGAQKAAYRPPVRKPAPSSSSSSTR